jgi:hypothetical protein
MPTEVTVKDVREFPSRDPKRLGVMDVLVHYQAAGQVDYVVTVPKERADVEGIKAAIKADLDRRRTITAGILTID